MRSMIPIFCYILITLLSWGVMYSFQQNAQKALGPWNSILLAALGWVSLSLAAWAIFGRSSQEVSLLQPAAFWAIGSGVLSSLGTIAIFLAFRSAQASGNMVSATWVLPIVLSLLPVATVVGAYFIVQKPSRGYLAYLSPGYLTAIVLAVSSAVMFVLNKPR